MPLRSGRLSLRATLGRPGLLLMAIGLTVASAAPTTSAQANASEPRPATVLEETSRVAAGVATARATPEPTATERGRTDAPPRFEAIPIVSGIVRPSAALEPIAVEQGNLTARWRETNGLGPDIAERTVRIEQAAATPTGCGAYTVVGAIALSGGAADQGALSLGSPPTSGCLRVSLALTDRTGRTSIASSQPYRVQPPAVATAKPKAARWSGRFNLFRENAFVTQKTFKWCVAASVQMMVNIVRKRTDRSRATQARMIAYAQHWDNGPYGEEGGTDVTGWIAALRHYGAGRYRAVGATTAARALRVAATAMAQTGRPAGILVMDGRHAWVLHGFESKADPRRDRWAKITAVRVSGPLYPVQQKGGYDPRPNTRLSVRKLERFFLPTSVGTMVGKYVVVIPTH